MRFSTTNLLADASLTGGSTTFTETDADVGVRHPERPFLPAYSADVAPGHRVTFDFGDTTALGVVALINVNFDRAWVSGNATDEWAAPSYSQLTTITRSVTGRYHHGHRITSPAFALRYLSIHVDAGAAVTDGATRFKIGGAWAGALTASLPVRIESDEEVIDRYAQLVTADGRPLQTVELDEPSWRLGAQRLAARCTAGTYADLVAAWREVDRLWTAAPGRAALVMPDDANPAAVYVARRAPATWRHVIPGLLSESDFELAEVVNG